jgi:hypothetical protein
MQCNLQADFGYIFFAVGLPIGARFIEQKKFTASKRQCCRERSSR